MATMDVQKRQGQVHRPATKSGSPTVPVCTVSPQRLRTALSSSMRETVGDEARTGRQLRRSNTIKPVRTCEPKSPVEEDRSMKAAIFDLLNYRPITPATNRGSPNAFDVTTDYSKKYRLMYLVVRAEQQQDHLRDVITAMRNSGSSRHSIRLMIKIKEALLKLHAQMLGIRDNDLVVIQEIGGEADVEEFFCMVENTCSAIEEIPKEGYAEDIDTRLGLDPKGADIDPTHPRVRVKSMRPRTECKSMFADRRLSERVNESNNSNEIGVASPTKCNADGRKGSKSLQRSKSFAVSPSKNTMYNGAKYEQDKGVYPCRYQGASFEDEITKTPTAFPTGLLPVSQMPTLKAMTRNHDPKLHSLMKDIDGLLIDVGVANSNRNGISFEELMWNEGKGTSSRKTPVKNKKRAPEKSEVDYFIEELDRLLDEAEK